MNNSQEIAILIKQIVEHKPFSISKMLSDIGLGRNAMSHLDNGSMLKADNLAKIADYLDVSTDYLLGRTSVPLMIEDVSFNIVPSELENAEDITIKCPKCNDSYVSFNRFLEIKFKNDKNFGIGIEFVCECGHTFCFVFEFHKGQTFALQSNEYSNNQIHNSDNVALGENAQVHINNTPAENSDEMTAELIKRFKNLSFDEKIEVFNYIKNIK